VIQGLLCRAAGSHWHAGPGKRSLPGISGRHCAPEKKGEEKEKALTGGAGLAEGEKEKGESARAGLRCGLRELGLGAVHAGKGKKRGMGCQGEKGPAQGEGEREQAGLRGWAAFSSFLFFPFSFLYSNHSNKPI
jgi:hypothetical protein